MANWILPMNKTETFRLSRKSYRNDRIIEMYMDQLNILAELDSLSPIMEHTHARFRSLAHTHTWMQRHAHKIFHAANCQFDRSKLSSTPYFPSNEKQAWSPSLSHAHTPTHTSRLDIRGAYMLQFIKRDRLDQRLNTGPVEICTRARIDSIVTIHVCICIMAPHRESTPQCLT